MATDLQTTPQTETSDTPKPACCPWRTALQVPLLLCAAAGLGFAGQQAWQNRSDFQSLWPNSYVGPLSSAPTCSSSIAHSESCAAAAMALGSSCASSANRVAEVDADESVSALSPENTVDEL